jgi:CheY-like chemotaxis protein
VTAVADVEAALAELRGEAEPFRLMFTNLQMPGMDGLPLIAQARRLFPELPCVLHTVGAADPSALPAGVRLLEKTIDAEKIGAALREALRSG